MIQDSERARLRYETARAIELDSMITGTRHDNPLIVSLPLEACHPPAFVRKTAPDMYAELETVLIEVRERNEQCVGERLLDTAACMMFAGLRQPLVKRMQKWCGTGPFRGGSGGGLKNGRDFGLFKGREGCSAGSCGGAIARNCPARHVAEDAEFVECQG